MPIRGAALKLRSAPLRRGNSLRSRAAGTTAGAAAGKDYADRAADYQRRFKVREVKRPIARQMREAAEQAGDLQPRPGGKPLTGAAGSMAGKKSVRGARLLSAQ